MFFSQTVFQTACFQGSVMSTATSFIMSKVYLVRTKEADTDWMFWVVFFFALMQCFSLFLQHIISALHQLHGDAHAKMQRILQLISGGGLSITNSHLLCGDFLYSGHTVMLTLTYLFIKECEYSQPNLFAPSGVTQWKLSWIIYESYCVFPFSSHTPLKDIRGGKLLHTLLLLCFIALNVCYSTLPCVRCSSKSEQWKQRFIVFPLRSPLCSPHVLQMIQQQLIFPDKHCRWVAFSPVSLQTPHDRSGGTIWCAGCWVPWVWCASWWLMSTTVWMWLWPISSPPDCSGGTTPWQTYRYEKDPHMSHTTVK